MVRRSSAANGGEQVNTGLASFITRPEKTIPTPEAHGITNEAVAMASHLKVVFSNASENDINTARTSFRDLFYERLDELNAPEEITVDTLMTIVDGLEVENTWTPEELQMAQLAYDVKDAVALAMVTNAGTYSDEMMGAINNENGEALERLIGINDDSTLNGLGEVMIDAAIVNQDLADCLRTLQIAVDAGNIFEGTKRAISTLSRLREQGTDAETDLVFAYINEIQAGLSMGRGGRADVRIPPAMAGYDAAAGPGPADFGSPEQQGRPFDISQENLVKAAQNMQQIGWRADTPPEWYGALSKEAKEFVDVSLKVAAGASYFDFFRNMDLEKLRLNPSFFMSAKEAGYLMNDEFKWAASTMINELFEPYTNVDGITTLRFKQSLNADIKRMKEGKGFVEGSVGWKLFHMSEYQDSLAERYAASQGREVGLEDRLNVINVWNYFHMTGVTSLADVDRVLPPNTRLCGDKLRTCGIPWTKYMRKYGILDGMSLADDSNFAEREWIGSQVSIAIMQTIATEQAIGKPINGKRTLKEKIKSKELPLYEEVYVLNGLDLVDVAIEVPVKVAEGEETRTETMKVTLMEAMSNGIDFKWPQDDRDILSKLRDQWEGGFRVKTLVDGKFPAKTWDEFMIEFHSAAGLLNGIVGPRGGDSLVGAAKRDHVVAMAILAYYGPDLGMITSGYFRLSLAKAVKGTDMASYNSWVDRVVNGLALLDMDVNPDNIKRILGKGQIPAWDAWKTAGLRQKVAAVTSREAIRFQREVEAETRQRVDNQVLREYQSAAKEALAAGNSVGAQRYIDMLKEGLDAIRNRAGEEARRADVNVGGTGFAAAAGAA